MKRAVTARTGWIVVFRCGCARVAPTPGDIEDACPEHGAERIKAPELVTDHRADEERLLLDEPWFGFHPTPDVIQRAADQDDAAVACCGRCDGDGMYLTLEGPYGEAWTLCGTCAGTGERRAA